MRHKKLKVRIIKDIIEPSNSKNYYVGQEITVTEIKKESEFYQIVLDGDIDMIPKDCVEIIVREK